MDAPTIPLLRVKALQPRRRRAGIAFTSEPSDLTIAMLGSGLIALIALAAILADPLLSVSVVEGDTVRPITDEERDELTAVLEAEGARVNSLDPPTDDAAEAQALAEDEAAEADAKAKADAEAAEANDKSEADAAAKAAPLAEDKKPEGTAKPRVARPKG